ncbi:MAG: metallophosphoesterase [Sediminibacterium sp.]|nr:metallophosphoesterase [Sediminibacterium sp.]
MSRLFSINLTIILLIVPLFIFSQKRSKQSNQENRDAVAEFKNKIPQHLFNIILGRPTNRSITLSVQMKSAATGFVRYGKQTNLLASTSSLYVIEKDSVAFIMLDSLEGNSRYYYQWVYRNREDSQWKQSEVYFFQTERKRGEDFVFTVQADSHLDENTDTTIYLRTLQNMRNDKPDFLVDLGDTWMTDKYRTDFHESYQQYHAQRYYFGKIGATASVLLTLGNHDGESGQHKSEGQSENIMQWATRTRNALYPNPFPNHFYSGNQEKNGSGNYIQNYYAFHWGDALIIVLDPFRYTTFNRNPWMRTLGKQQYNWLRQTLFSTKAKYKFIFIHNLVGGVDDHGIARGGSEAASLFEWGGNDITGERKFEVNRPEFDKEIEALLRETGVNIVFHGHDHFFAKQEKDGIVYQLVPQPGGMKYRIDNFQPEYGYKEGIFFSAPGYIRVSVSAKKATIEFLQTGNGSIQQNGKVLYTYEIQPN